MEVKNIPIKQLHPYKNNPRKNDDAVGYVANSIQEFGFKVPIVIDKDNVIVAGHTRYKAAKKLKIAEVPCIVAEDLTDAQIKAFRLADNKVGEVATWDTDLLDIELSEIDIDMTDFGFDFPDFEPEEDNGYYGDERERTFDAYNLREYDEDRTAGKYQMPMLRKTSHVPKDLISFNYLLTSKDYHKGIHFYIDDYQFERVWNRPTEYIEKIKQFDCALTPDFSLYTEMPVAMQIWNVYRSRLIGQMMQDAGIEVIPTLQWCMEDSFEFCFDGIPEHSVVSVSTIGVKRDPEATKIWTAGMDEAMKRLKPKHVVLYGGDIGYEFDCRVTCIDNHNAERINGK